MRWLATVPVPLGTSLVSEGHSLVPVAGAGALVSFGGYNDRYHNSVFVLRPVFGSMSAPVVAAPSPAPVDTAVSRQPLVRVDMSRQGADMSRFLFYSPTAVGDGLCLLSWVAEGIAGAADG